MRPLPERHEWLECPSGLSATMPKCLQGAYRVPTECPMGQSFRSLFVRINKSVVNATLTEWFLCRKCEIKIIHEWIILIILALENNIRVIESAGHTLESKGSVGYRHKSAHLIYSFQKTYQK